MAPHGLLGATFVCARIIQLCSLIAIIGLTANFIAEIVSNGATPPAIFIGTITVTSIAVIYSFITAILFLDNILPFLISAILDTLLLIAVIVVSVIIGKPLSYLQCNKLSGDGSGSGSSAYTFATHLSSYLEDLSGGTVNYTAWIGASKSVCLEAKSIWGLCIAMCVMFFVSGVCGLVLWRQKKAAGVEKLDG
ncbi:hypothetical protein AbraIFM66951_012069 [Aspergillus brasiliensis]|uniref:MARVEL domain-containing protein n=1 Tax=Aspergillus brasiliensis TaxID=319629 RepID=A0A9W6DRU4_9EURO|nr:hypothetical protein AbraCBS73388_002861 [Aspergillus brasiliensis]GKZ33763.1 hypothetical protein AbraIFM66950_003796 [Aspergillus brasiliensis]GKZ48304.1 hypothetical protein AbraIFM66951_012069 [Aspergillus brasiliensis]